MNEVAVWPPFREYLACVPGLNHVIVLNRSAAFFPVNFMKLAKPTGLGDSLKGIAGFIHRQYRA